MIHETHLATWVIQTLGRAAGAFLVPPLVGGFITFFTGVNDWAAWGSVVGIVGFVIYLSGVVAPMPTDDVIALVLGNEEEKPDDHADPRTPEQ